MKSTTLTFLLSILCCLFAQHIYAQESIQLEKGDDAFYKFDYKEALFFYETLYDANPKDPDITRRIAKTYHRMGQIAIAAEWYQKTLEQDASNAEDLLAYAEILKMLQQYDESIHWYDMYYKMRPHDSRAQSHLRDKQYYRDLFADTAKYNMKSLAINNELPVLGISSFDSERFLVCAIQLDNEKGKQTMEGLPYLDVYECSLSDNEELINPKALDKNVNSKYHDGPAQYSFLDQTLYVTRNNMRGKRLVTDKSGLAIAKIYAIEYKNGKWSGAEDLSINSNDFTNMHPSVSKDGLTLYFVSNRPGGIGGTDIYMSSKSNGKWSDPVNLGPKINTAGNEQFPYISSEGYLYFASNGHAGLGGLDVFVSEKISGEWQYPLNMGAPVNTNNDDFSLIYDKDLNQGFFCSNRSGNANDDLFYFKRISMERMLVAGTIKSNIPNLSFAGERVQINKVNKNLKTYVVLDEFERFEVNAEPGDIIEITMMNAEYFDPNQVVYQHTVEAPIVDPFIYLGETEPKLLKVPTYEGRLSKYAGQGLAPSTALLGTSIVQPEGSTSSPWDSKEKERLDELNNKLVDGAGQAGDSKTNGVLDGKSTQSQLNTDDATLAAQQAAIQAKIKEADAFMASKKYEEARSSYISVTALDTKNAHATSQLKKIDGIFAKAAQDQQTYDTAVLNGDQAFLNGQFEEAIKEYKKGLAVRPTDAYLKKQFVKADDALKLAKPVSIFDNATAAIDLEGMDIHNIIFDYNKALISAAYEENLKKILQMMKDNPNMKLMIKAHCDSRGSLAYNQSLSMTRAMAVQGWFMQRGIKRDRLYAEWFGEQRPLNGCLDDVPCEEDQHEINRRAELKLVNM
jgi:outer membrane protein OmpA-like peptidoglycan-associated protein